MIAFRKHIKLLLLVVALTPLPTTRAQTSIPSYYLRDAGLDEALKGIVKEAGLDSAFDVGEEVPERISFAVIDLNGVQPVFAGVNYDNFIYPASIYKMYVAMEVLKQTSAGRLTLHSKYVVRSPNNVDKHKEISHDPRPLLTAGDTVTIHYLLDLMITRSDNTAANCLIDIVRRPEINLTMLANNWGGSEVTRKFISRSLEDPGYGTVRSTETCGLHAADFFYKISSRTLVNPWVSLKLESLLGMQLDTMKLSEGFPSTAMFYHKTGWWGDYTHDAGIVIDGNLKYIIAIFTPLNEGEAKPRLRTVASSVHQLMQARKQRVRN